jgi:hypothetical protein
MPGCGGGKACQPSVGEMLRAVLEALAVAARAWPAGHIHAEVVTRYAARIDEWRLPAEQSKRRAFGAQIGADGWRLLQAMTSKQALTWLWHIPVVQALGQI